MGSSLQRILLVDSVGALATVVVMIGAAEPLAPHVGIPPLGLKLAGAALIPFVIFVFLTARSSLPPPRRIYLIISINALWFVASVLLLCFGALSQLGGWIIALQALLVVPLIVAELRALGRA